MKKLEAKKGIHRRISTSTIWTIGICVLIAGILGIHGLAAVHTPLIPSGMRALKNQRDKSVDEEREYYSLVKKVSL